MQLDAIEHFTEIVLPALSDYHYAEEALTRAIVEKQDEPAKTKARHTALRLGGSATLYLHHFADVMANRPPDGFPNFNGKAKAVREWLASHNENAGTDLAILEDIADALKHAILTHRLPRQVEHAEQVLAIDRAYGSGNSGDGKYGGIDEVWVLAKSGKRTLTKVLTSVADLWKPLFYKEALCGLPRA